MKVKARVPVSRPKPPVVRIVVLIVVVILCLPWLAKVVYGDPGHVQSRSDTLSDANPGATATNNVGFQITDTSQVLGSIQLVFCQESPLPGYPCSAPSGFNASGATLVGQSGNVGFSIASATTNAVVLTRVATTPTTALNSYTLAGIVSPSVQESYYLRIYIYPTLDASGSETQNGGVALVTTGGLAVNAIVPPFLELCTGITIQNNDCATASGDYIDLGNFSSSTTSSGTSQLAVATNAESGYTVTTSGSTLTSGNDVITASTTPTAALRGVSQFGMNLRANAEPAVGAEPTGSGWAAASANYNIPDSYLYNSGDTIITSPRNTDFQTFTSSYITDVSSQQNPGIYATTISYICLANF